MVALQLMDRDFWGMTLPLSSQVAPALFLWFEWAMYRLFGGQELALRLWSILAGCGGLLLLVLLARAIGGRMASLFAVGMLAVANFPIRHAAEVKPYSSDLLFSVALLVPAGLLLRNPRRVEWLAALTLIVPVAMMASYPAVFVAAGISVGQLPAMWQQGTAKRWTLFLLYNATMVGGFLAAYRLVGAGQYAATHVGMLQYWQGGFPPAAPWNLLRWLVEVHTGNMFALPFGGANGASTATTVLFLLGAWRLWRKGRWGWLLTLLTPFVFSLLAAVLKRYPYGASARLSQYLAPSICVLGGLGAATVVSWVRRNGPPWLGRRFALVWILSWASFGAGVMVHDVVRPGHTVADIVDRRVIEDVFRRAKTDDRVVVLNAFEELDANKQWYFLRAGRTFESSGAQKLQLPEWGRGLGSADLWLLEYLQRKLPRARTDVDRMLAAVNGRHELLAEELYRLPSTSRHEADSYWQLFYLAGDRSSSYSRQLPRTGISTRTN